ncbi:MAG: ROK family protein [Tissierellia bacterium]|nr:ROK family protein [Tissierellia bacterium]
MDKFVIGIDVGGRSVKFGLFSKEGKLIDKSNIVTRVEDEGKHILDDIYDHLLKIIEKHQLNEDNLLGIGLGIPGAILNKSIVQTAVNLGWGRVDVKGYFSDKFPYKVLVENDANVAALGEAWQGAAKDLDSIVMVTLGTGVGGGIIIDGKIVSGNSGAGGEIGHMPFLENALTRTCGCGGHRCFEQVASATGLESLANEYLFNSDEESVLREIDGFLAKDIFEAYKNKDKLAVKVVEEYYFHLARGLAIVSSIIDPQAFVIGGGVSNSGDVLIQGIQKEFVKLCFPTMKDMKFIRASLGNDAGIYGAAKLVI